MWVPPVVRCFPLKKRISCWKKIRKLFASTANGKPRRNRPFSTLFFPFIFRFVSVVSFFFHRRETVGNGADPSVPMAIHQIIVIFHRLVEFFFVFFYGNVSSFYAFIHSFIRFVGPSVGWKRRAWRAAFVFYFVFLCLSLVSVGFFVVCFLFLRARVCVFRLAAGSFSAPRLLFALDVFFLNYHLDSDVHRLDSSIIRAFLLADSHLDRSQWKSSLEEIE